MFFPHRIVRELKRIFLFIVEQFEIWNLIIAKCPLQIDADKLNNVINHTFHGCHIVLNICDDLQSWILVYWFIIKAIGWHAVAVTAVDGLVSCDNKWLDDYKTMTAWIARELIKFHIPTAEIDKHVSRSGILDSMTLFILEDWHWRLRTIRSKFWFKRCFLFRSSKVNR